MIFYIKKKNCITTFNKKKEKQIVDDIIYKYAWTIII